MKKVLFLLVFVLSLPATFAQTEPNRVVRILTIGNSFSEDAVEQYLWEIAHEKGIDLTIGNLYHGGCSLERHADNARTDSLDYAYRRVIGGVRQERPQTSLHYALRDEAWDFISLQQVSQYSGKPETFEPYLSALIDTVRHYSAAPLVWHMTWAYSQDTKHSGFAEYDNSQQLMYDAILSAAYWVRKRYPFQHIVPSGTAIQLARASELGDTFCRDGYHLNLLYGRYCVALTWAETLLGIDAKTVKWHPKGVTAEQADIVKNAAHLAAISNDRFF